MTKVSKQGRLTRQPFNSEQNTNILMTNALQRATLLARDWLPAEDAAHANYIASIKFEFL